MTEYHWIIFSKDHMWFTPKGRIPVLTSLPFDLADDLLTRTSQDADGHLYKALSLPAEDLPEGWQLLHFRQAFERISSQEYQMACRLKELLHWEEAHQFCGQCGHPLEVHTEISKHCPDCGREFWPSPSPAIIVLVEKPAADGVKAHDEVLMIHAHSFPGSFHSLVAGYVESGETLEDTVAREVFEETGIHIMGLRYVASQSWPFPFVQMIGFRAQYAGGTLRLQEEEIARGGWFRRDNLPELPGKISLARKMIDQWLAEEKDGQPKSKL